MNHKRGVITIPLILITMVILAIVGGGIYYATTGQLIPQAIVSPTPGCQFINNIDDPNLGYTDVKDSSSYTCDSDECIVSGVMSVVEHVGETVWKCDKCGSKSTCSVTKNYGSEKECSDAGCFSGASSGSHCKQLSIINYGANYNFCPDGVPNFPNCAGSKNTVTSTNPGVIYYTDEYKLSRGQSISFTPKNSDGSDLTTRTIRIRKYDCSCLPAVESGSACSTEQKQCSPNTNDCPSGYTYFTQERWCSSSSGINSGYYTNMCRSNSNNNYCIRPATDNSKFQNCDSTQQIGQATCGAFNTQKQSCPTGQQCFVDATGAVGAGLGGCRCAGDVCILGETKGVSETTYQECVTIGSCLGWSSDKYCAEGLVFDEVKGECVCSTENSCVPGQAECVGSQIRECKKDFFGGKSCYKWQTASSCAGDLKCLDKTGIPDVCSCEGVSDCQSGDIKCSSSTSFLECAKDPLSASSCLKFRDLGGKVSDSETCNVATNEIETKPGCQYDPSILKASEECKNNIPVCKTTGEYCTPTASDTCSGDFSFKTCKQITGESCYSWQTKTCPTDTKCSNGQCLDTGCAFPGTGVTCDTSNFEECKDNSCVCKQDSNTASEQAFTSGFERCLGNFIQKSVKHGNCYRWENKEQCSGEYFCVEDGTNADCTPTFKFVGVITKTSYGIGEEINNVQIIATDEFPVSKINQNIIARLLDGTNILVQRNTLTDSKGEAIINFNYANPRTGSLDIEVTVGDPLGTNFKQVKTIEVKNTLDVKLNCPPQGFVKRAIECTWKIEDANTGTPTTASPKISVTQGGSSVSYSPVGTSGVSFTAQSTGSVEVSVEATKTGFISDTATLIVPIQQTTTSQTLNIDNKDFFSYAGLGINTGTHQLQFKVEETGVAIPVQSIDATIRTPSGQVVPVVFNKVAEGDYKTTYNFQQSGTTYFLSGTIYFIDITKEPSPFEYPIVTLAGITEENQDNITIIIIAVGVGIFVILIIIGFLFFRRRR